MKTNYSADDLRSHDLAYLASDNLHDYQIGVEVNPMTGAIQPIFEGPDGFKMTQGPQGYIPYYPSDDPRSGQKITAFVNPDNGFIHVDGSSDLPNEYAVNGELARKTREELLARQALAKQSQEKAKPQPQESNPLRRFLGNTLDAFNFLK